MSSSDKHIVRCCNLGRTGFADIWELQRSLHSRVAGVGEDVLLLNEHEHVYTLGKGGDADHLLANDEELKRSKAAFFRIDRGGDITYHGPGQIVGYPILNLERHRKDVHWYLRQLEETIIRTLNEFGIAGSRSDGETGVWVNGEKIAALGIKVSRWVTMHGFAFNVNTDLSYFARIIPCGIFHKGVTSMAEALGGRITVIDVLPVLMRCFEEVFGVSLRATERSLLEGEIKADAVQMQNAV
jgi:lipoyl(octanoyl) transferase